MLWYSSALSFPGSFPRIARELDYEALAKGGIDGTSFFPVRAGASSLFGGARSAGAFTTPGIGANATANASGLFGAAGGTTGGERSCNSPVDNIGFLLMS